MKMQNSLLLFLGVFLPGLALSMEATIEAIGGAQNVRVNRSAQTIFLKQNDKLITGDELVTDKVTAVDIRLEDKTAIRIGVNSTYKLQEDSKTKQFIHRLVNGVVRVLVPKQGEPNKTGEIRFKLNTPEGTIGVRGTEFVVISGKDETQLKGLTGEVMFGGLDADYAKSENFVLVAKGFQSAIKKGAKMPSAPEKYDLDGYSKTIDMKGGQFGSLADRIQSQKLVRGASVAMAPQAAAPLMKAMNISSRKRESVPANAASKEPAKKADPNELLILACNQANWKEIKRLLDDGASVNYKDENLNTPLHVAVVSEKAKVADKQAVVQGLIDKKADINAKNADGRTPLMLLALESGEKEVAQVLLINKADFKLTDKNGKTALALAKEELEELNKDPAPGTKSAKLLEIEKMRLRWGDLIEYLESETK